MFLSGPGAHVYILSEVCVFLSGPGACEQKGTLSSCSTDPSSSGRWSVVVLNSSRSGVSLSVLCPSDACIGRYSLSVRSGSSVSVSAFTVLFNPWSKGTGDLRYPHHVSHNYRIRHLISIHVCTSFFMW